MFGECQCLDMWVSGQLHQVVCLEFSRVAGVFFVIVIWVPRAEMAEAVPSVWWNFVGDPTLEQPQTLLVPRLNDPRDFSELSFLATNPVIHSVAAGLLAFVLVSATAKIRLWLW